MTYQVAEKFKSIQGEGVYAGTPMAFIRFVGCSVGKRICQHCDTDFDKTYEWRGGGTFSPDDLIGWTLPYGHICFTGGEPLNQNLSPLIGRSPAKQMIHIETSGTVELSEDILHWQKRGVVWICVSPKPGFREDVVLQADEVKVIVPGLGEINPATGWQGRDNPPPENFRWPTISDALRWAHAGKTVFLQPRNAKFDVDKQNLLIVQDIIRDHPELRLSVQLHKILKVQ